MLKPNAYLPRSTVYGAGKASIYTIIAGVFLAAVQVANQLVINSSPWRTVITVVIGAAGAYGIQPLFGPGLTNLLHIPAQILFFIAGGISAANGAVSVIVMSTTLHTILAAVITLIGSLLFGSPILVPRVKPANTGL